MRVLKPGGRLLYSDLRGRQEFSQWEAELAASPLREVSARVINKDVVNKDGQPLYIYSDADLLEEGGSSA
mgnify:CR=1 FL=1